MSELVGAGLTALAIGCFLGAPMILGHGLWRLRRPRLCLTLWYLALAIGVFSLVGAAVTTVAVGTLALQGTAVSSWPGTTAEILTGWVTLALLGPVVGIIATQAVVLVRAERVQRMLFERLVAAPGVRIERIDGVPVYIVPSDDLVAVGLRRRGPRLLVSRGVLDALTAPEVAALVAHEQAHLRGLHDVALRVAALNLACLPTHASARALSRSTALLVELAADRSAAARTTHACTASALRTLATRTTSPATARSLRLRAALLG